MKKDFFIARENEAGVETGPFFGKKTVRFLIDIQQKVALDPCSMAREMTAIFLPEKTGSQRVRDFGGRVKKVLAEAGSTIMPFESAFVKKASKKTIKEGVVTFVVGERKTDFLPIRYVMTSTSNPIVTIVDMPSSVHKDLSYKEHMEIALNLFSWHMSHVVICVDDAEWIMYSFNGLSDFYPVEKNFESNILNNLIPKITSRIAPPKSDEFIKKQVSQDFIDNKRLKPYVVDLVEGSRLFGKTGLFNITKDMGEFKYKHKIYKRIVSKHLDERKGMSYGFLARFLPFELPEVISGDSSVPDETGYFLKKNEVFLSFRKGLKKYSLKVPRISVLMTRSGCNKTALDAYKDILKITLNDGRMSLEIPPSALFEQDYRPSFDTRVILAHGLSLVVYCAIARHEGKKWEIIDRIQQHGCAIGHWHGAYYPELPEGYFIYGNGKPPVLCSSYQSVIYAFIGKAEALLRCIAEDIEYKGDVHLEPQHGVNMLWDDLCGLAEYVLADIKSVRKDDLTC